MLEPNKDPYENAVRVLDTPKLDGKPQDCTQPRSVSTSVDYAALSTLQARLEHHLCSEQSSAIAGTSREAPVASLIDLSGETSIQGTSGLAHISPVQADATVATAHSRGHPRSQGSIAPHSASGNIESLAPQSVTAASVKYSGGLRNSTSPKIILLT